MVKKKNPYTCTSLFNNHQQTKSIITTLHYFIDRADDEAFHGVQTELCPGEERSVSFGSGCGRLCHGVHDGGTV